MISTNVSSKAENKRHFISEVQPITEFSLQSQLFECEFNPKEYNDHLFETLAVIPPESIHSAKDKRKAEFLAGRYCAQQTLKHHGYKNVNIPVGQDRCPQWPEGIAGSITHAGNRAICAISRVSFGIGIDYELPIADKTANEIKNLIVGESEKELFSNLGLPFADLLTLTFSIKESLFKALYPRVKKYFDFLDAELFDIDLSQQKISLRLQKDLNSEAKSGQTFNGKYHFHKGGILTLIEY